jgi:hypothetical protein
MRADLGTQPDQCGLNSGLMEQPATMMVMDAAGGVRDGARPANAAGAVVPAAACVHHAVLTCNTLPSRGR